MGLTLALAFALASIAACSRSGSDGEHEPPRKPAGGSPACVAARHDRLGAWAECVEVALPELETQAGKLVRVWDAKDPRVRPVYVLTRPSGNTHVASDSYMLDEIARAIDPTTLPPEKIAQLGAALIGHGPTVIRCLPGANDTLPGGIACAPPTASRRDGQVVVDTIVERFPYPGTARDDHELWRAKWIAEPGRITTGDGSHLADLPPAPLPAGFPPPPRLVPAPDRVARPEPADAATEQAICDLAREKIYGVLECKAWAYPELDVPTGRPFFVGTSGASSDVFALRKPDGSLIVGFDSDVEAEALKPLLASWDPSAIPVDKLLALRLFLSGRPEVIRCRPGRKDALPGKRECKPPVGERVGDDIVIDAIIERLPLRQPMFSTSPHDLVRMRYTLGVGGGLLSEHGPPIVELGD